MTPALMSMILRRISNMTTSKLKELMQQYCIVESELDDVFAFVADLLYLQRRELEQNEPYATRKIDKIYDAECIVNDLENYISELEEDE